jgi:hypothetical protein
MQFVVAALVGLSQPRVGPAAEPPADPLKGLTPEQARERVIASLKEWDAKLANVRYVVRERSFTDDAATGRDVRDDKVAEVRRHPDGHWMRQARYKAGETEPYREQITNVRRNRGARIFGRDRVRNEVAGGLLPEGEATNFVSFWFNQMTGFRVTDDGPPRTVAAWVEEAARTPPRTVTCSAGVVRDMPAVCVAVCDGFQQTKTFYLDPSRDWMIVRADYIGGTATSNSWSAIEVEKADVVDGVWFPLEAHCLSGNTPSRGRVTDIRYTVEAVAMGKVTEADLEVPDSPKGTDGAQSDTASQPRR